ncbi:MAG: DUF1178 family protein [Rhodocyclaceae bacterium]|jgi:hypothetical protein|nr:DUF1178 family protein [Rhodocyclaceae bacterium]
MIVLNLSCPIGHKFEGWFVSTEAFDDQAAQALVTCPVCGLSEVSRLPSGPMVRRSDRPERQSAPQMQEIAAAITRVIANAEDVSDRFAEEARKIHYGEADLRSIKGTASGEEAMELIEEGIMVLPLGAPEAGNLH